MDKFLYRVWESPLGRLDAYRIPDDRRNSLMPALSLDCVSVNTDENVYPYNCYYVDVYADSAGDAMQAALALFEGTE